MPIRQASFETKMNSALAKAFRRTISVGRWRTYLRCSGHQQDVAVRLYLWNAAISQSFYFPLQAVEVSLRNVLAAELAREWTQDWWQNPKCLIWIGAHGVSRLKKVEGQFHREGRPLNTDQVVASLSLGFWVALLRKENFWTQRRHRVFPALKSDVTLSQIRDWIDSVHRLRNRIAHHEPVFLRDLSREYSVALSVIAAICPDTKEWVQANTSVPAVLRLRPRP